MEKRPDWTTAEVEAVVADYFAMIEDHLSGRPFVKAEHTRLLQASLDGRTRRSVEEKRHNIGAVLAEQDLAWLPGYVPKHNYQQSLADCVIRYLAEQPELRARLKP